MQKVKHIICLVGLMSLLFLISCDHSTTNSEKSSVDTMSTVAKKDSSFEFVYDSRLDPLIVGASFSKKLGDTLNIKMFEVTMKPGDSVAIHTHPDHSFYVIQGGKIEVTFKGMGKQIIDLKPGMGWIGGPTTDFGKNIGTTTVQWVETDVYRPRGK